MVPGRLCQLGHRAIRVSAPGSGQPDRLHGTLAFAAQDSARSDHPAGVCAIRGVLHATTAEAGLSLGCVVSRGRGVLRVPLSILVNRSWVLGAVTAIGVSSGWAQGTPERARN